MKVILVIVMSLDGKTTKENNPDIYHWSSKEDQKHFFSLIEKSKLLLMGRNTYEHAKHLMQHKKGRIRVILTSTPEQFQKEVQPGILEFTNTNPPILLTKLAEQGYKEALLLGGAQTATAFAQEHCIDEVWLTIEPYLFGKGKALFTNELVDLRLKLISSKKLNKNGTLLLKYQVLK